MKFREEVPDALPDGGLIENRDGLVGAIYDDFFDVAVKYATRLSRVEMIGALEQVKFNLQWQWKRNDDAEDEE